MRINNKKILIVLSCISLLGMVGCKKKTEGSSSKTINTVGSVDKAVKPAGEDGIDLNSLFQWDDVKSKFETASSEAADLYYETIGYDTDQKNAVVAEIKELIPEFENGGTIYQIKDACTLYKDASLLIFTSSDLTDTYRKMGEILSASILAYYGGYNYDEGEFDPTSGISTVEMMIDDLGI